MAHILLIDDEIKLTEPLRTAFERDGYDVSVANDGHTGFSLALVEKPDVVVLDVMMPGLDGWQVCRELRQHSSVPIIMLTALDDPVDRIKGLGDRRGRLFGQALRLSGTRSARPRHAAPRADGRRSRAPAADRRG